MASEYNFIISEDTPEFFHTPNKYKAQIIWFGEGFISYKFYNPVTKHMKINYIEISFEACSEAPNYRNVYKSDISLFFNNVLLGIWTCRGDYGGRPGSLNPKWWSSSLTQYGELKTWRITQAGTFLDNVMISSVSLRDIDPYKLIFDLRVGVSSDAVNKGGMNLFGSKFGDYCQNLIIKMNHDI